MILTEGVPFSDARHYFHVAARRAASDPEHVFFTNQFENTANADAHFLHTGPEMWRQLGGRLDGFVCSSGTGGTIGGLTRFFKVSRRGGHTRFLKALSPPPSPRPSLSLLPSRARTRRCSAT